MLPDYPDELLWHGRQIDQVFLPEENLYYRVTGFDPQGKVKVDEIRCPDTSVNRGKYSKPEYVLYAKIPQFLSFKVAQFKVHEIPNQVLDGAGKIIAFRVVHDPTLKSDSTEENYAHSEIRAFYGNERKKNVGSVAAKEYRMKLRKVMVPAL